MILYSVIVPAYNAEKTVDRCLSSLLNQSIPKKSYEVILVDDGSIDGTAEIAKAFPVKYLRQSNSGPASARNNGVKAAKGEIILFTDSDCVPRNDWIKEMVKPFKDPEVMAVKGSYKTEQKSLTARFAQIEFEERFEMLKRAESIDMVDTYSAAYRRAVFLSMGGFDPSFPVANNEDTDLSYKMSGAGHKMVFNPDAIVFHLNHPDSIRKYARLKLRRGYWRMVVYRRYPDKMLKDSYTPQTLKFQILFLFLLIISLIIIPVLPAVTFTPAITALAAFIFICLPFTVLAFRRDVTVGLLSPLFLSLRAASLGIGSIWGILSLINLFNKKRHT